MSRLGRNDLDASMLVFVTLKGSKPRRRVAVPVPESQSWAQFTASVQRKLGLATLTSITLAATGKQITDLSQISDIDDLIAEGSQAAAPRDAGQPSAGWGPSTSQAAGPLRHESSGGALSAGEAVSRSPIAQRVSLGAGPLTQDGDEGDKYVRKQSGVTLGLKRMYASLFGQPMLPVTRRDAESPSNSYRGPGIRRVPRSGARARRGRSWLSDPRALLGLFALLSFLATLVVMYTRMLRSLPS